MFLLDNDTTSLLFRGQNALLNARTLAVLSSDLWLPVIVLEEQYRGRLGVLAKLNPILPKERVLIPVAYHNLMRTQMFLSQFQIAPYTQAEEDLYQGWPADVKRVGRQDCRIAAIAILQKLTLITANVRHFEQIPNLNYEDWSR